MRSSPDELRERRRLRRTVPTERLPFERPTGYACPSCPAHMSTKDSRRTPEGYVRRRRVCLTCGDRITTVELPVEVSERGKLRSSSIMEIERASELLATLASHLRAEDH